MQNLVFNGFRNGAEYRKFKQSYLGPLMDLCLHQIWNSLVHAPLRTSSDKIAPGKWAAICPIADRMGF